MEIFVPIRGDARAERLAFKLPYWGDRDLRDVFLPLFKEGAEMLRINRTDHPKHILLVVEGTLAGDNVGVIASECEEALSTGTAVTVFLKNITGIDANGQEYLKRLAQTKARVRALGIYSRFLVRRFLNGRHAPGS